jgi:hypothetical protein
MKTILVERYEDSGLFKFYQAADDPEQTVFSIKAHVPEHLWEEYEILLKRQREIKDEFDKYFKTTALITGESID